MVKIKKLFNAFIAGLLFSSLFSILLSVQTSAAVSNSVVPIKWSNFTSGNPTDKNALRIRNILLNTNKYALTTWWDNKEFGEQADKTYLKFDGTDESHIRPPASQALALAISLKTGIYDPVKTGVSLKEAKAKTIKLITSIAYRHKVNKDEGWGDGWQTAHWAGYAGFAGWLMWSDLSAKNQEYVRKMVEYEANRFIDYEVPYYKDKSGEIIYPGDTKAEENAWNAKVLGLATSMMPNHASWNAWMSKNLELMISAYSRPVDVKSTRLIHGRPLSGWLNGSNANDNGTVINHDRIHPVYMVSISHNIYAALTYTMAGKATPLAAFFNADVVYDALIDLNFKSPPWQQPGGTIYVDKSDNIYYPEGSDGRAKQRINFALIDVESRLFKFDRLASSKGDYWESYHAQKVLDMQNRFTDGHTYKDSSEYEYSGREGEVAANAAQAYLSNWIIKQNRFSVTDKTYPLVK